MTGAGKVVCVTGATGFIASWLVKLLLDRGYTVNATVRSLDDPRKTAHLVALDGAKERLHLFEANLTEDGSFDPALDGCHGVFHTASPAFSSAADPQAELIVPAVKGTLNVLTSCAKFPSIKRVVVTSSMSAVMVNGRALKSGVVIDETWFTDPAFCEQSKLWYPLSKALAEDEAWKFSKLNGIDVVMLHPGLTIGPLLQPTLNASCQGIFDMLSNGTNNLPKGMHRYVDVRDVARAHISAFEIPSASGRYCLVGTATNYYEVMRIFHKVYPAKELPEDCKEDYRPDVLSYEVSKERARSLGIDFIPFEETIKDFVECLKERKLL